MSEGGNPAGSRLSSVSSVRAEEAVANHRNSIEDGEVMESHFGRSTIQHTYPVQTVIVSQGLRKVFSPFTSGNL